MSAVDKRRTRDAGEKGITKELGSTRCVLGCGADAHEMLECVAIAE